jgi:hypothetical protein
VRRGEIESVRAHIWQFFLIFLFFTLCYGHVRHNTRHATVRTPEWQCRRLSLCGGIGDSAAALRGYEALKSVASGLCFSSHSHGFSLSSKSASSALATYDANRHHIPMREAQLWPTVICH